LCLAAALVYARAAEGLAMAHPTRIPVLGLVSVALAGCTAPSAPAADPIPFCEGDLAYHYAPDEVFETFPDDHWTVEDASTATGLRVQLPADDPALAEFPDTYRNLLDQLGTLDGFGLSPALVFQFSAALPDLAELDVVLLVEGDGAWVEQDATLGTLDYGRTLTVTPWRPLPPGARGVLAVRTDPTADGCISPSPALRELLTPDADVRLADRYAEGLAALGWAPEDVGAMVVFTTQSAEDVDAAVAADVAARTITLDGPMTCADEGGWRDCLGSITVGDYRADDGVVPAGPVAVQSSYALPVELWLPPAATPGPYPVVLCGHGLGGSKSQCQFMAELGAPLGIAAIAVDAQQHGEHPRRTAQDGALDQITALFGFTLSPPSLNALVLRDNFRASAWDKLQVVRAIALGLDVEGDGIVDLDPTRIAYAGASLGGIMGPELVAWSPDVQAGVLAVPGGGLMNLVLDSDTFGVIAAAMTPPGWDADDLARAIPLVQTLIDAGDPLVHAGAITRRRAAAEGPDVVLLMAYQDAIVPNSATAALAQAFAVEGVGAEPLSIPGITFTAGPLAGNLGDGATGGLVELAETQPYEGAAWEPADHSTLHESVQAKAVMEPFLTAVFAGAVPTVADPYAE
jgi:dienelactone hydrolase